VPCHVDPDSRGDVDCQCHRAIDHYRDQHTDCDDDRHPDVPLGPRTPAATSSATSTRTAHAVADIDRDRIPHA
jgi:hypothetical protein